MDKNIEQTQFLLYKAEDGKIKVDVLIQDETVWLTIEQMAELFGKSRSTINEHILNIYKEGELEKEKSMRKIGNSDFSTKPTNFYNLDVIISVGYRVKSIQGTRFRQWATKHLKEFIIKGFTMDDERLKEPKNVFGKDFFATVQNKLHWAIVGETAAEIIYNRVDSNKENMGLTTWKNAPDGKIRKTDVVVAKNYLNEEELDFFNRIVTMYLDYAEMQALKKKVLYMKDWVTKLDAFLQFNEKEVLEHKGTVSNKIATELALTEYEKYRVIQDRLYKSDFDILLENLYTQDGEDNG